MTDSIPRARIVVVGGGPRASFFLRQATLLPERFEVVGVHSRSAETRAAVEAKWGFTTYDSVEALIDLKPDFAFVAVARVGAMEPTIAFAEAGIPVMVETPPAPGVQDLRDLWTRVGSTDLVQVAEHSMYMPSNIAKLAAVEKGMIGTPTSVHVSSNHQYHAVAIMRGFLQAGLGETTVRATDFTAPLVNPVINDVWQDDLTPQDRATTLATVDFGGTMGLYDFTDLQWFNPLRSRRLLIRGSLGEFNDNNIVRLSDDAIVESHVLRRQTGIDLNHEGFDLDNISIDGQVLYRNPFKGRRMSDEDIAAANLLAAMTAWVLGDGPAPYPLADGSQDHLIGLAIEESAATSQPVTTAREAWAK
ncbi:MAG TPA: Gfo/Idh/MocA family oxidoreductase [Microbacteriaceae bacterium]|nr:Gfo/Idh/MocA family oxidoreductase [Microbacteriaceae bacterium]